MFWCPTSPVTPTVFAPPPSWSVFLYLQQEGPNVNLQFKFSPDEILFLLLGCLFQPQYEGFDLVLVCLVLSCLVVISWRTLLFWTGNRGGIDLGKRGFREAEARVEKENCMGYTVCKTIFNKIRSPVLRKIWVCKLVWQQSETQMLHKEENWHI